MRPIWVLSAPDGPHIGPMNLAMRVKGPKKHWLIPTWMRWHELCKTFPWHENIWFLIKFLLNIILWDFHWSKSLITQFTFVYIAKSSNWSSVVVYSVIAVRDYFSFEKKKNRFDRFNHIYFWQMPPQLSCEDTCQIWTWYVMVNSILMKLKSRKK